MSGSVLVQMQNAVRDALLNDESLGELITGVFDHIAPADQPSPYVVLGEKTEKEFSALGQEGSVATLVVEVRSQAMGDTPLLNMYSRAKDVLETAPLSLGGYAVVSRRVSLLKTAMDADGITRRAEARLEVTAQVRPPLPAPPEPEEP